MKIKEVEDAKELVVIAADYYWDTIKRYGKESIEAAFAQASLFDAVKQHRVEATKAAEKRQAIASRQELANYHRRKGAKKK